MPEQSWDTKVRMSAFRWLDEVSPTYEAVLPRDVLQKGFELEGQQIHLMSSQDGSQQGGFAYFYSHC
jgi:hypothetical protein